MIICICILNQHGISMVTNATYMTDEFMRNIFFDLVINSQLSQ